MRVSAQFSDTVMAIVETLHIGQALLLLHVADIGDLTFIERGAAR